MLALIGSLKCHSNWLIYVANVTQRYFTSLVVYHGDFSFPTDHFNKLRHLN